MADRSGMGAISAKPKLAVPKTGAPGNEEFCFFVCASSPPPGRALWAALPVVADVFKRLALVIGAVLLLAAVPGVAGAAEAMGDANRAKQQWISEAGFIAGYGRASIDEGSYKTMLLIGHIGTDITRFVPPLRSHRGILSFFLEPQFNPVLTPSESEFGLGFGLQYTYPLTETISPYVLAVTGPHYISVDTTTQAEGYNFSSAAGVGLYISLTKTIALNCGYRYRHISNADLKLPNGGINSHIGVLGLSFFF